MEKQWISRRNPRETLFKPGLLKKAIGKVVQRALCPGPAAVLPCPCPLPGSCCSHGSCVCVKMCTACAGTGLLWSLKMLRYCLKAPGKLLPPFCLQNCVVGACHCCATKVKCTCGNPCWVCASFIAVLLEEISMPVLPTAVCSIPRLVAGPGPGL